MSDALAERVRRLHWLVVALWSALQLLYLSKTLLLPMGGREPNVTVWLLHCVPLLPFVPGLFRGDYRTFTWLAFAILFYFAVTVEALFMPERSAYHWVALVLILGLFAGCLAYVRSYGQLAQAGISNGGES